MIEKSLLLRLTGDMPLFKILDFFIEQKGIDVSKKDISSGSGISKATLFNYWPEVEKAGLVVPSRKFGKTVLFTLNTKSQVVKKILELESELIRASISEVKIKRQQKKELLVSV